ncbi:CopG family transcriptional regulator [Deinococcus sp. S9]|uniref:ribbon-helix-helix domain-containing protein n=1 Tax=Deinococcus sp. S9 TaxID=2545754 RepID=UPI001054F089|nr:CopG family transcriptional regulator [Deinococcus sp. S9]TDE84964.1 CopG family transcriptional regulator [Deinococcus sp. S9]
MGTVTLSARVDDTLAEQIDKLAASNGITRSRMIEELLVLALGQQETELASTFLMPRLEGILTNLFDRHLGDLRLLMVHAAVESTIASRLTLFKYKEDNGYGMSQLSNLRDQAYKAAVKSLRRKGVGDEDLTDE